MLLKLEEANVRIGASSNDLKNIDNFFISSSTILL